MAEGTILVFDRFKENLGLEVLNLSADTFSLMLVQDSGATPAEADSDPKYDVTGTPDYSAAANEVDDTGLYTNGGDDMGTCTWVEGTGTVTFDAGDVSSVWLKHVDNDAAVRWGVVYDSAHATNIGVCFVDLGAVFDMKTGDLTITWNASGIFTLA
jgi:hypothetical protein